LDLLRGRRESVDRLVGFDVDKGLEGGIGGDKQAVCESRDVVCVGGAQSRMYSRNILPEKADLLKNGGTLVERRDVAAFVELGGQIEVALLDAVEIWLLQLQRLGLRSHLDQRKLEGGLDRHK